MDGIARPRPAIAFNTVHKELTRGEVHGVGGDVPDAVDFVVRTTERTGALRVERSVFVVHEDVGIAGVVFFFYIDKAEGFGVSDGKTVVHTTRETVARRTREHVERFAMVAVKRFLAALAVIDADGALEAVDFQIAESLTTEVVEDARWKAVGNGGRDGTLFFALQMELRGGGIDSIEVPRGNGNINTRAMGDAVLVNPKLVLVGGEPTGISMDGIAVDEEGWRRGLVPNLDVELVLASGDGVFFSRKLEFAVDGEVELAFDSNGNRLPVVESESLRELNGDVMAILFPKRGKHGAALGAAVIEDVAEPDFEVARIPDPGGLLTFGY